jgi:hypothetical protein
LILTLAGVARRTLDFRARTIIKTAPVEKRTIEAGSGTAELASPTWTVKSAEPRIVWDELVEPPSRTAVPSYGPEANGSGMVTVKSATSPVDPLGPRDAGVLIKNGVGSRFEESNPGRLRFSEFRKTGELVVFVNVPLKVITSPAVAATGEVKVKSMIEACAVPAAANSQTPNVMLNK